MTEFGVHLRERRESLGLSLHELGVRTGVSKVAVYKWEHEITHPAAERMPKIADALSCSIDALYGRSDGSLHTEERFAQRREGRAL